MRALSAIQTHRLIDEPEDPGTVDRPAVDGEPLILGRYRLTRRLGSGGFATVHAAHDERLDRQVAIKILPRERVIHSRFQREARAAARLHHPGIVTLFEAAVDDDGAYLVSELVRGSTLDQSIVRGELSDRGILEVAIAIADALEHAHAHDVIHRDVKPQNVLVPRATKRNTASGGGLAAAKLTDFGVAHVIGSDVLTRTGDVIGTLAYMSPEQAEGRTVGPSADLYSLALLTYEGLTGVNPVADNLRRGINRRLGAYLPPLRRQRADLPRHLGSAIDRALRPRPAERGSVAQLRVALLESLDLVEDVTGVVADAKPLTLTRWSERTREDAAAEDPGPEWLAEPRRGRAPAVEPPADRRATLAGQSRFAVAPPGPLCLLAGALAVGLGWVGLAAAWPALVGLAVRGWVRRTVLAAAGLAWLGLGTSVAHRDLLYHLPTITATTLKPVVAAMLIWGLSAAILPLVRRGISPLGDLVAVSLIAAAGGVGLVAVGLPHLHDLLLGALLGWLLSAQRPLLSVVRESIARRRLP